MWSLEMIDHLNQQAAKQARRGQKQPYVPDPDEIDAFPPIPFPHLGPFVPKGWQRAEQTWFVDSSGWGRPGEPALAVEEFKDLLRRYVADHPDHGFGIVEAGQFQVFVGAYKRRAVK